MDNFDENELRNFSKTSGKWWDKNGPYTALHHINPLRINYVSKNAEIAGSKIIDIGCGGGILTEALALSGGYVTGLDMDKTTIDAAKSHMFETGVTINYTLSTAENYAESHKDSFDILTCMELLEHVPNPVSLINACTKLVKPGGSLFFSTINRTMISYLLVILVSEYVLKIIEKGTHSYRKLIKPAEIEKWGLGAGLEHYETRGIRYIPFLNYSALSKNQAMNYLVHFKKPYTNSKAA